MANTALNVITIQAQTQMEEKMNDTHEHKSTTNGVSCEKGTKVSAEVTEEKVPVPEEEVPVEVEPKTGVYFPVKLDDGKQLMSIGVRKKSMLGIGIKIYSFGDRSISQVSIGVLSARSSIKKLMGGKKNDELANKIMGQASDGMKLKSVSVIEVTQLPGYVLQTKVKDEVVSKVESEVLCRRRIHSTKMPRKSLGCPCFLCSKT